MRWGMIAGIVRRNSSLWFVPKKDPVRPRRMFVVMSLTFCPELCLELRLLCMEISRCIGRVPVYLPRGTTVLTQIPVLFVKSSVSWGPFLQICQQFWGWSPHVFVVIPAWICIPRIASGENTSANSPSYEFARWANTDDISCWIITTYENDIQRRYRTCLSVVKKLSMSPCFRPSENSKHPLRAYIFFPYKPQLGSRHAVFRSSHVVFSCWKITAGLQISRTRWRSWPQRSNGSRTLPWRFRGKAVEKMGFLK